MAGIVKDTLGLFGPTPQELEKLRQAELAKQYQMFAQQGGKPGLGGVLGTALGSGLARLFGNEDPEIKKATDMVAIQDKVATDLSPKEMQDPNIFFTHLANTLQESGYTKEATQARQIGAEKIAEYNKNLFEQQKSQSIIDLNTAKIEEIKTKGINPIVKIRQDIAQAKLDGNEALAIDLQNKLRNETRNMVSPENQAEQVKLDGLIAKFGEEAGANMFADWKQKGKEKVAAAAVDKDAGTKVGDILQKTLPVAENAVTSLNTVSRLRTIVNSPDVIMGPGATIRTSIAQIANTFFGASNEKTLKDTRTTLQGLASLALAAASKVSGQGSISNFERESIQKASSAGIDELTKPELQALLDVVERDAKQGYDSYTRKWEKIKDPDLKEFYAPPALPATYTPTKKIEIVPGKKYTTDELKALQAEIKG
jgi:hypothetical protein